MLLDRGVEVDHTTIFRWMQAYAVEPEKRIRLHLRMSNGFWRVDETYVRVKALSVSRYRQPRPDDRLSALCQARCLGSKTVFPEGLGAATHGERAHHHGGQERGLSEGHHGDEEGRQALAPISLL
jgi:hypothetical protein